MLFREAVEPSIIVEMLQSNLNKEHIELATESTVDNEMLKITADISAKDCVNRAFYWTFHKLIIKGINLNIEFEMKFRICHVFRSWGNVESGGTMEDQVGRSCRGQAMLM